MCVVLSLMYVHCEHCFITGLMRVHCCVPVRCIIKSQWKIVYMFVSSLIALRSSFLNRYVCVFECICKGLIRERQFGL